MSGSGRCNSLRGFILLPMVFTLVVLAAVAYLLSREAAMNSGNVNREQQRDEALYVAQAGYNHAVWDLGRKNCTGYTDIASANLGQHSYSASITDSNGAALTAGSPANIFVTSTLDSGASYTLKRYREKVYQTPSMLSLQLGTTPGQDAWINSFSSSNNYGIGDVVVENSIFFFKNQLIQFDISSINAAAIIQSAQLQLYQKYGTGFANVEVYRVNQDWVEGTQSGSGTADGATWRTRDGSTNWLANGGDYDPTLMASTLVIGGSAGISSWDVTSLVQSWQDGSYPNYGMLLKTSPASFTFASKEDSTAANRPKLVIYYTCECGVVCVTAAPPPAKKVYWTDDQANKIQRSDEDGSNVEDVLIGLDRPTGLDIDTVNGKLYWTNNTQIMRANLNGSSVETVYSGSNVILDIKLDVAGGKMYWTLDISSGVMRANLDGSSGQTINSSLNRPAYLSLDLDAGHIYLTNFGDGHVSRMNLDGSGLTTLVTGSYGPVGSAIDPVNGKIYWSGGATNDWIKRANLDGSNVETIVTGLNAPQDLVYDTDNNRIYWVDAWNLNVQRADPDGSNLETIVSSGLTRPRGIELVNADLAGGVIPLPSTCSGTFRDQFNSVSFGGNDGSLSWTGDWQEVGEFDGANSGDIRVINDASNYQLRLQDNDSGGEGVAREADLTGAGSAILSLNYRRSGLDGSSDYVTVEISSTGTAGPWTERGRFQGYATDSSYKSWDYTLTASEISANTAIRLRTSSTMGGSDAVYFDNIQIQCTP